MPGLRADLEHDEILTDTGRERVAAAVAEIKRLEVAIRESENRTVVAIERLLDEREKSTRSFWRAVFDAIWSGVTQAHNSLKGIIKE